MIYYFTPYSLTKNLGEEYNKYMSLIGDNDHAVLMDGDVCFLTPDYGMVIAEYVEKYPNAVLTCWTNRIHPLSKQLHNATMDEVCDMRRLIVTANAMSDKRTVTPILPGEGMSGFLMVLPKHVSNDVPFKEGPALLGVDSRFRIDLHNAGVPILIMDGVFVYHTYRLGTNFKDKSHLL